MPETVQDPVTVIVNASPPGVSGAPPRRAGPIWALALTAGLVAACVVLYQRYPPASRPEVPTSAAAPKPMPPVSPPRPSQPMLNTPASVQPAHPAPSNDLHERLDRLLHQSGS
jgi:hypothetical protein